MSSQNTQQSSPPSRWGPKTVNSQLPSPVKAITAPMTHEQIEAYALHVRIQEIAQRLDTDDFVPANSHRRSPSPVPQYDNSGRRTNTRYQRYRQRLEAKRHALLQHATRVIPNYPLPPGSTRPTGFKKRCTSLQKTSPMSTSSANCSVPAAAASSTSTPSRARTSSYAARAP